MFQALGWLPHRELLEVAEKLRDTVVEAAEQHLRTVGRAPKVILNAKVDLFMTNIWCAIALMR